MTDDERKWFQLRRGRPPTIHEEIERDISHWQSRMVHARWLMHTPYMKDKRRRMDKAGWPHSIDRASVDGLRARHV